MMELIKWKKPTSGPSVSLPYQALELTTHDDIMSKTRAQAVVTGGSLLVMVVLLLLHCKVQRVCSDMEEAVSMAVC